MPEVASLASLRISTALPGIRNFAEIALLNSVIAAGARIAAFSSRVSKLLFAA